MEQFSGGAGERVDGQVTRYDHRDRIKNGAVDVARGGKNHVVERVGLAAARRQLAVNVLDHHDRAVNDDSEVDRAYAQQVCGLSCGVQKDEREEQRQWNCESGDYGGADAYQEK